MNRKIKFEFLLCFSVLILFLLTGWVQAVNSIIPEETNLVADIVEKVGPSVVYVDTLSYKTYRNPLSPFFNDPFFRDFFDIFPQPEERRIPQKGLGSGFIFRSDGYILTNEHVIQGAEQIKVTLKDGREFDGKVIGSDPLTDIAIIKVDATDLPALPLGDSDRARVGEWMIAIGNPYGLSHTVTVGVLSAKGRPIYSGDSGREYENFLQTDAAINPGNSGGALLDADGNPLGIVTAIYGEGKGIGFAIPIDDVLVMLEDFLQSTVKRPIIGFFIERRRDEKGPYLYINKVLNGSPAEKYGIRIGDRITELNRKKIREGMKIQSVFRTLRQQESIQLKVAKGAKSVIMNIDVKDLADYVPAPMDEGLCSVKISDIKGYPKLKFKLKEKDGVVVTKVISGSPGPRCGLRIGDVVFKINNNVISNKKDFDAFMAEGLKRNYILYQVKRRDEIFFLPVKLDTLL